MDHNSHVIAFWRWIVRTGYQDGSILIPIG